MRNIGKPQKFSIKPQIFDKMYIHVQFRKCEVRESG